MTSTSHCVQDFSSPSSRRKKSTTPVQSPRKAKEVLKAPSLALQSTNNNRHPRSNAAKSVKNLQNFKQVSQLICVYQHFNSQPTSHPTSQLAIINIQPIQHRPESTTPTTTQPPTDQTTDKATETNQDKSKATGTTAVEHDDNTEHWILCFCALIYA